MFIKSWNRNLQQAWLHQEEEIEDINDLARWAIKKEDKKNYIDTLTGKTTITTRTPEAAGNSDGTFRTTEASGDPMDLDATRRRPNLNLSRSEFQRRMREKLCLRCGKPGHQAKECHNTGKARQRDTKNTKWQPRNTTPWRTRPAIKKIELEEEAEQSGNEESPQ